MTLRPITVRRGDDVPMTKGEFSNETGRGRSFSVD